MCEVSPRRSVLSITPSFHPACRNPPCPFVALHADGNVSAPTHQEYDMAYIDGFVMAIPTANKQVFTDFARKFDPIFLEHGATRVVEGWGDDVSHGKQTDFFRAVAAKDDETVAFSWIEWPDKATRDAGMDKVMKDPRMDPAANPMPFDGARMIYGGFSPVLDIAS
jgi:uncharacterized protein YbaA (DUF1428 family)